MNPWPDERLPEAVVALVTRSGLGPGVPSRSPPDAPDRWIPALAAEQSIEAEAVEGSAAELTALLRSHGPALLRVEGGWLAVLGGARVRLLEPDLRARRLDPSALRDAILDGAGGAADIDRLLDEVRVPPSRRARARRHLLDERSAVRPLALGFILRLPPGAPIALQARAADLPRRVGAIAAMHLFLLVAATGGWALVGRGLLDGRLDAGWLAAWGLLVVSSAPVAGLLAWVEGRATVDAAALLRQRLLAGALAAAPDDTRRDGTGRMIGRVLEADALEGLATGGGWLAAFALLECAVAGGVLGLGAGGALHAAALAAWMVLGALGVLAYHDRRRAWTRVRLGMTHGLIESMLGHRTRLAQEPAERWHEAEDAALVHYVERSREMDAALTRAVALFPSGWLLVGLAPLVPAFLRGDGPGGLAVGVGGVLMAWGALRELALGFSRLSGAAIAWEQVRGVVEAGRQAPAHGVDLPAGGRRDGPLLEARGVSYRHASRARMALEDVSLELHAGDRVLLEGPSGGGKSTLGAVLAGLRLPESGVLLLDGVDHRTLGPQAWRRRVVTVPQFHENHVFGASLAFNLLLGRAWPPSHEDLARGDAVCRELGLGEVLDRMPGGIWQPVGETGWQLSHGERSRVYLARALLQDADVLVLDESFAALDPENLDRAMRAVLARKCAVVVIAHP